MNDEWLAVGIEDDPGCVAWIAAYTLNGRVDVRYRVRTPGNPGSTLSMMQSRSIAWLTDHRNDSCLSERAAMARIKLYASDDCVVGWGLLGRRAEECPLVLSELVAAAIGGIGVEVTHTEMR